MKEKVMVEKVKCDYCGEESWRQCLHCGKDICYDCQKTRAREYKHAVHYAGSGDGIYCNECDEKLRNSGDKLHAAYLKIEALRNEANGFYANLQKRGDEAEKALKSLLERRTT